jgi:hypothetical protein
LSLQGFVVSTLKNLASRIWWPIAHGSTDFKHYKREAAAIKRTKASHFASWLQAHVGDCGKHRRQLAVLVYGSCSGNDSIGTDGAAVTDGANSHTGRETESAWEDEQTIADSEVEALAATWIHDKPEITDVLAWRRNLPRLHGYFSTAAQ